MHYYFPLLIQSAWKMNRRIQSAWGEERGSGN